MATTSGQKRKRLPSSDTTPNLKGRSFGMDLDYFGYDSSNEGEEPLIIPSKPPNKICRTSGPELENAPTISQATVFAKEDREKKEGEEQGWWPALPQTPRSWDVPPLTPIHAIGKSIVPSPTNGDSNVDI